VVDHRDHPARRSPARRAGPTTNTGCRRPRRSGGFASAPASAGKSARRRSASRGRRPGARRRFPEGERIEEPPHPRLAQHLGHRKPKTLAWGSRGARCRDRATAAGGPRSRALRTGALPLAREVGRIDALPAAIHVAAIGEQRDPHGKRRTKRGRVEVCGGAVWRRRPRPRASGSTCTVRMVHPPRS